MSYTEQKAVLRQSVKQELRKLSVEVMTKESKQLHSILSGAKAGSHQTSHAKQEHVKLWVCDLV